MHQPFVPTSRQPVLLPLGLGGTMCSCCAGRSDTPTVRCRAWPCTHAAGVRREKAALSDGCKPRPAPAPAESNRSNYGGNEMVEAFGYPPSRPVAPSAHPPRQWVERVRSLLSSAVGRPTRSASSQWQSRGPLRFDSQPHDGACQRQVSQQTGRSSRRTLAGSYRQPPTFTRPNRPTDRHQS